jgi:hypothetical protein
MIKRPLIALTICLAAASSGSAALYPVPPPWPVKTDLQVGAFVFPGWHKRLATPDYTYSHWELVARFANPRPVLGFYDESLPEVNDWHINWALEAGVSWFAFDWYYYGGECRLERALEEGFLKARYTNQMKFCIHWCNHPVPGWPPLDHSPEGMAKMLRYCAEHYFTRPNYLRLGNRPVFMGWDIEAVLKENGGAENFQKKVLPRLNAVCREKGLGDLFLILVSHNAGLYQVGNLPVGDAFTGYSYGGLTTESIYQEPGSAPYAEMVEALPLFWRQLHRSHLPFITSTSVGWDNMPNSLGWGYNTRWARPGNTPALFERTLREGKRQACRERTPCRSLPSPLSPSVPFPPLFVIDAWNEWGEGHAIEPDKQHGFGYLEAVRRVFAPGAPPPRWVRPTLEQVDSYSVFTGEERLKAHQRELQPDPPPTVPDHSVDLTVDPQDLPGTLLEEFRLDRPEALGRITLNEQLKFLRFRRGRACFEVTGGDAQMLFQGDWGELQRGHAVAIRLRYSAENLFFNTAQLYWATDGAPLSGEHCRLYSWRSDGRPHTYLLTFKRDRPWTGRLTSFRIDPPATVGAKVEMEWVRLLREK